MTIKKIIGQIHLWLGLASGLVVFILGITGCIQVFAKEIKDIVYNDRLYVKTVKKERLPLSKILAVAEAELGKERKISRAELSQRPDRSYMFRALKLDKTAFGYWNYYVYYDKVYIDPYTAEVLCRENAKWEFFNVALGLHMYLLLGDEVGHTIVRWSVVCFGILLISGIVLWWPKRWKRKQLKQHFKVKWSAKFKRLNYDLHNVFGFYAWLLLMVSVYTGLMWSFELATVETRVVKSDTTQVNAPRPTDQVYGLAKQLSPDAAYFLYNFPAASSGTINVTAYQNDGNVYDRVQNKYDRYTGRLLLKGESFSKLDLGAKIINMNYDLHTGTTLGWFSKVLAFFASLVAASLPVTGFIIWLNKGKKQSGSQKR